MHNESPVVDVAPEVIPDYRNPAVSPEDRVADLLRRMTMEEKVAQMLCLWGSRSSTILDAEGRVDRERARKNLRNGVGQIGRLSDIANGLTAKEMAARANDLQKFFIEETRLGIPVVLHEECLHGLAGKEATSYPQPIALASTFNPQLVHDLYSAVAEDARMRGAHQALAPVLDVARDPRWGRVEETFGEDPYLVARMGEAAVIGFQGKNGFQDGKKVLATVKHYAAHGEPESGSNCGPANISERTLRDIFLFPFRHVIHQARPASVMASYNEVDGVPSHSNAWLLRDVLRHEWGFDGFVVSDYYAITELHKRDDTFSHAVAEDKAKAAMLAARAGVNLEFPDPDCYPMLVQMVRDGRIEESTIDELVIPLLRAKIQLGLFEQPYVPLELVNADVKLERDRPLALESARESIVLLKNENGMLPLNKAKSGTIAVIGPNADRVILGGYSGTPKYFVSILEGIRSKVGKDGAVLYHEGCKITIGGSWNQDSVNFPDPKDDRRSIAAAVETAKQADTIVLVIGENEQTSREAWSTIHLGDRTNLEPFGMQMELARALIETGKPIVLLLCNGRPNSVSEIQHGVRAILECWYLGQETGTAIADVLFGECNPSGKLPISIPRSVGHIPCFYNHKPSARRGYIDGDISPLFPFGFGLSYTRFQFSNVRLKKNKIRPDESTELLVDVSNGGDRAGVEVVQMYIRDTVSSVTRPVKELKGFMRIALKPGEKTTVSMSISPEHLAFTDINMKWTVEPGSFDIMVGNSSRNEDLLKTVLVVQ